MSTDTDTDTDAAIDTDAAPGLGHPLRDNPAPLWIKAANPATCLTHDLAQGALDQRPESLFFVRESDEFDAVLFDAMREQTYQLFREIAEVDAIRELGMLPMECKGSFQISEPCEDGTLVRRTVLVEVITRGRTRAYLFHYRGHWHLWSKASATKANDEGLNEVTEILCEVIRRVRPRTLRCANFSRLIRSQDQAGLVLHACNGNVETIYAGTTEFPLTGSGASVGKMMFSMFAMVASMERDWIVQRLLTGRIAKWRRGEWPYGASTIPFGYRLNTRTKTLEIVPEHQKIVREMLLVLAGDLTPRAKLDALGGLRVTGMRNHRGLKRRTTLSGRAAAKAAIDNFYAWAPIWIDGEYLLRLTNVFPGMTELAGAPIVREDDDDDGELQMLHQVPVPESGWAEAEVIAAFRDAALRNATSLVTGGRRPARALGPDVVAKSLDSELLGHLLNPHRARGYDHDYYRRRKGGDTHETVAPLTGRSWVSGGWTFELRGLAKGRYGLWRWPLPATPPTPAGE